MKTKIITLALLTTTLLTAQEYTGKGLSVAESKKSACSKALQNAKIEAMEKAGTVVFSNFNSSTSDTNGKISKSNRSRLTTASLGVAKLKEKSEDVKVSPNYQFSCSVQASFEIDQEEMKSKIDTLLKQQENDEKASGYFQAEGYSEEGQSRYKAFSSATLLAQRNLLEVVKGADITSLTKMDLGEMEADKVGKLIGGTLVGAEVVQKEYDKATKSAKVVVRIKKADVVRSLEKSLQ
ncbi:MAG: hypothetical protein U9O86_01395 [Campylobacterota bacterium]|nr:hypothetical protein [Campylobacterota bacterium]